MVLFVAGILMRGSPTLFQFEGLCRQAVRSGFILQERYPWPLADVVAQIIVRRALRRIGAFRPRWHEGQKEYCRIESRIFCAHCEKPITRESFQALMYCSERCRSAAKCARCYAEHREARIAYAQAQRDRQRAAAQPRECQWCGASFQPLDDNRRPQRFCGKACRSRYASQWASQWRPHRLPSQRDRQGRFIRAE